QGSPVPFNPSIISIAEDVRGLPGIKRGKDYHYQARQLMESSPMKVSFPKEIYTQKLGGIDFDIMETTVPIRGIIVKQKYYETVMKGYALGFIVSFTTDEEAASLQKVLDTIVFN